MSARAHWIQVLLLIVNPVFQSICDEEFKNVFPPKDSLNDRAPYAHLEALGRSLAGLAPWLELQEDAEAIQLAPLVRRAIDLATDPKSSQYMVFAGRLQQPLVDAGFFALGLVRAPNELWQKLEPRVQRNVVDALKKTRRFKPHSNNWVLFASMIEVFFHRAGQPHYFGRLYHGVEQFSQWYLGDGVFGDGPKLTVDYYNSFVIQPFLFETMACLRDMKLERKVTEAVTRFAELLDSTLRRSSELLEQLIAPDGSYPALGRSITYRCGAFQTLALTAQRHLLPATLPPGQVRTALSRVINRTLSSDHAFDAHGWLRVGLVGHQPHLAQWYTTVGSLYLATTCFLPLGLPAADPFWVDLEQPTSWERLWAAV